MLTCGDKPPRKDMAKILAKVMANFESNNGAAWDQSVKCTAKQIWQKHPDVDWQLLLLA